VRYVNFENKKEMQINSKTKIADLLKFHPDALEAIITLSPDFKKLRNPVLRKLMAGRTSIGMASKIGGCKPEDFFEILKPLGFVSDNSVQEHRSCITKISKRICKGHRICTYYPFGCQGDACRRQ
jgi:hypothetical protein